jgi:antitoxin component YwqK of YwqJK toxin-antitoxin module
MLRTLLAILALTVAPIIHSADELQCPSGTTPNGETTPDVSEAWCEVSWNGKTVMHGPYRAWWPNGRLGTSGQYNHGEPEGKWSGWYPSGQLQGEEWFESGKRVKSRYFDKKGKPTNESET